MRFLRVRVGSDSYMVSHINYRSMKAIIKLVDREDQMRWAFDADWLHDSRLLSMLWYPAYRPLSRTAMFAFCKELMK